MISKPWSRKLLAFGKGKAIIELIFFPLSLYLRVGELTLLFD